jgi:hypothetical protein
MTRRFAANALLTTVSPDLHTGWAYATRMARL